MDDDVVTVRYRSLKPPEAFFVHGRPLVDPKRRRLYLARRFDFLIILGLALSLCALLAHALLVFLTLPPTPKATNYVTSQCANMEGVWNEAHSVIRFWALPYAVPPVITSDATFVEVHHDLAEKLHLRGGGFRWYKTITVPHTEYCFLSFDDRCSFKQGQWTCTMKAVNRSSICPEFVKETEAPMGNSEHCLTLDISMPPFSGTLLPVIVVFTGFRSTRNPIDPQTASSPAYLPADEVIIDYGAIWVNVRYRLGPLGSFYDANSIGPTAINSTYVNFALRDQQAALHWIQQNIGRFGGDANRVVLLAHDTGATSALQLINMQAHLGFEEPWFRAAWLSSGALNWFERAHAKWQQFEPYQLTKMLPCNLGSDPLFLSTKEACSKQVRQTLLEQRWSQLHELLMQQYVDSVRPQIIWDAVKFQNAFVSTWYAVDEEFNKGTPIDWSKEVIDQMFFRSMLSSSTLCIFYIDSGKNAPSDVRINRLYLALYPSKKSQVGKSTG